MQSTGNTIFVGMKISENLRHQLDCSRASAKPFFEENNPEYLQVLDIDYDEYIGKTTESGASLEELDNLLMNVKTMLRMICPKFSLPEHAFRILALTAATSHSYI